METSIRDIRPHGAPTLIVFAWIVEVVGISAGMVNSAYITFRDDLPVTLVGWIPAIPLMALAATEFLRVPLASAFFAKPSVLVRLLIVGGLVVLSGIAVENWVFGLDRVVTLRLDAVKEQEIALDATRNEISRLERQRKRAAERGSARRKRATDAIERRRRQLNALQAEEARAEKAHNEKLRIIGENCVRIRERCMVPQQRAENARYKAERERLAQRKQRLEAGIRAQEERFEATASDLRPRTANLDERIARAREKATRIASQINRAKEDNPVYRLAGMWHGMKAGDVTPEQFSVVRAFFCTFGAVTIALAGTIAALVYYSRNRLPGERRRRDQLLRAVRGWMARKRRNVVRIVPGPERVIYRDGKEPPEIVEKIVDRPVDHIVLVPSRWARRPFYVNAMVRRALGKAPASAPPPFPPDTPSPSPGKPNGVHGGANGSAV